MKFKYICIFSLLGSLLSCEENESPIPDQVSFPELNTGTANFSNYVALGASFTAGFTDGALFKAGQENSFPNILSQQFEKIEESDFTQPLMNDNFGGLAFAGNRLPGFNPRLVFGTSTPVPLESVIGPVNVTTDLTNNPTGPFKNLGVPGAKSFHLLFDGYGNPAGLQTVPASANPYFVRMATNTNATILGEAMAQNPSFFTLSEIGGNDVLGFATTGGDGSNPITPSNGPTGVGFDQTLQFLISTLTSGGAKGVVTNVPYITDLPFFTTVPNNALVLDTPTAARLTGFFQAVSGIFLQGALAQQVPLQQAQALASQYAITFNEGPNRWIIDVPVTQTNPLGFRQMTEDELLLLTINQTALAQGYGTVLLTNEVLQVLGILQAGGTPTLQQAGLVLAAVNGIDDKDALDRDELLSIKNATDAYNVTIKQITDSNTNVALVDLNSILTDLATTGINFEGFTLNSNLVTGGAISLDGIHLTARGNSYMAYKFFEAIDNNFETNFIASGNTPNPGNFPTNYSPLLQ